MFNNNKSSQNATNSVAANAAPASAGFISITMFIRSTLGGFHVIPKRFNSFEEAKEWEKIMRDTCTGDEITVQKHARCSYDRNKRRK